MSNTITLDENRIVPKRLTFSDGLPFKAQVEGALYPMSMAVSREPGGKPFAHFDVGRFGEISAQPPDLVEIEEGVPAYYMLWEYGVDQVVRAAGPLVRVEAIAPVQGRILPDPAKLVTANGVQVVANSIPVFV